MNKRDSKGGRLHLSDEQAASPHCLCLSITRVPSHFRLDDPCRQALGAVH